MCETSLAETWAEFEQLRVRLTRYLRSSETEFVHLIQALDACWSMAESVQKATAHLAELSGAESDSETVATRDSMLEGCRRFKEFLEQIQVVGGELALAEEETKGVLRTSNLSREDLVPLAHIAFHLRLESCRLAPEYSTSVMKGYEEMIEVLGGMKQAGDSQQRTLSTILERLSAASRTVERASTSYADQATASEKRIHHHLDLLLTVPPDLVESRRKAASLGGVIAASIREAVKALQGHDAIRQRLEHILGALAEVRNDAMNEPGHSLLLQRHQAQRVLELIISIGSRIDSELNGVIGSAQTLAGDSSSRAAAEDQVKKFEKAVDSLSSLSRCVAELLDGETKIGQLVLTQIEPIGELLRANSDELEALARSMKRLKRLALNVLVSADKMPSAQGIGVLSAWTSEAAERALKLANELDEEFAQLGTTLRSKAAGITADVQTIEACRDGLLMPRADGKLRNSRRVEFNQVSHLSKQARELQAKTEGLLQSLKFVDEGSSLLGELDAVLDFLLALYPKPKKPLDLDAAAAGYTMQEQRAVHTSVFGGEEKIAHGRLTEPSEGQDYGANVELF
jgi:hypothetical protein